MFIHASNNFILILQRVIYTKQRNNFYKVWTSLGIIKREKTIVLSSIEIFNFSDWFTELTLRFDEIYPQVIKWSENLDQVCAWRYICPNIMYKTKTFHAKGRGFALQRFPFNSVPIFHNTQVPLCRFLLSVLTTPGGDTYAKQTHQFDAIVVSMLEIRMAIKTVERNTILCAGVSAWNSLP